MEIREEVVGTTPNAPQIAASELVDANAEGNSELQKLLCDAAERDLNKSQVDAITLEVLTCGALLATVDITLLTAPLEVVTWTAATGDELDDVQLTESAASPATVRPIEALMNNDILFSLSRINPTPTATCNFFWSILFSVYEKKS